MPTFYSWKDSNGPGAFDVIDSQVPTKIKDMLKTCLVTGYPGKPGAGWRVVYETAVSIYFQNANQSGVVAFYFPFNTSPVCVRVYIMESVPENLTGNVPYGTNTRSSFFSMDAPTVRFQQVGAYSGGRPYRWCVVADENTMYFLLSSNTMNTTPAGGASWPSQHKAVLYIGEISTGQFVCIGGEGVGSAIYECWGFFMGGSSTKNIGTSSGTTPGCACFADLITGLIPPNAGPTAHLNFDGPSTLLIGSSTIVTERSPNLPAPPYFPDEVHLHRPQLCYGGTPIPGNARMKGLVKPLNLESYNYVHHYTFLSGAELTDPVNLFSLVDAEGYGEVLPFSGDPSFTHCYWLMMDEAYW